MVPVITGVGGGNRVSRREDDSPERFERRSPDQVQYTYSTGGGRVPRDERRSRY